VIFLKVIDRIPPPPHPTPHFKRQEQLKAPEKNAYVQKIGPSDPVTIRSDSDKASKDNGIKGKHKSSSKEHINTPPDPFYWLMA
jgi:hypothetical protein